VEGLAGMSDTAIPAEYLNQIVTGDCRELAARLPDASVDLIFTDPVYERIDDYRWLAETAARVLKPDSACLVWIAIQSLPGVCAAMLASGLNWRWQFIEYRANEVKIRPAPGGRCLYSSCLWFDKGKKRPTFVWDVKAISMSAPAKSINHMWSKPSTTINYYTNAFTKPGAVVFDPFTGGGTVPAVCKMLGRNWIAFEIDPATAEKARERVALTQVPLWVPEPVQDALPLEAA
jgi:modification methylase